MERNISEINDFFSEMKNLIEHQFHDGTQYHAEIVKKFKGGKDLIDELEEIDEKQHGFFRYMYHTKYADYLKKRDDVENTHKQEKLAKKYEKFGKPSQKMDVYKTESILFINTTLDVNRASDPGEKRIKKSVEEQLGSIQSILEDYVIKYFRQNFDQLFNNVPTTFLDYQKIIEREINLCKLADNPITEELIDPEISSAKECEEQSEQAEKIKKNRETLLISLNILKESTREAAYLKRIDFIKRVLDSSNRETIFFSNILFTDEGINRRFRELSLCFHPDKTSQPNTPYWLNKEHKDLGDELFKNILKFKETLLADLEEISRVEGRLTFHEKKANNLWKISIDYRNAAKGQWSKLKLLDKDDIKGFSSEELEYFSINCGELTYYEYRAACKIADKAKQLKKQVELRGNMALCLYVSKKFVEAQLYALSAIQLQLRNSHKITYQDLISAERIFDKVKGGEDTNKMNFKLNTEIKLEDSSSNKLAIIKTANQEISIFNKNTKQRLVEGAITELSVKLMSPDRSLVRYRVSEKEILYAKNFAFKHKVIGGTVMGGLTSVGTVTVLVGISEMATFTGVSAIGGPITLLTGGLIAIGLGIWSGLKLWKKGTFLLKEPEIREKLNEMMTKALEAYDKGKYQEFLEVLSEEYKGGTYLLKLDKPGDIIDPEKIIKSLLGHGFRPDGIAYLLNLLGVALGSGKIKIRGFTTKDLRKMAQTVFNGTLNDVLGTEAKKLDERTYILRKNRQFFSKISDFIFYRDHSDTAQEYTDDAREMPFQSRLEEMRNITRLNIAIFDILDAGQEEIQRAIKMVEKVRESIDENRQFSDISKKRLEAVDDLLWIIGGEESPKEEPLQITCE